MHSPTAAILARPVPVPGERPAAGDGPVVVGLLLLGAALRAGYVFVWHRAPAHVYSDMGGYVTAALRLGRGVPENITDTIHPPGTSLFFAATHALSPTWSATLAAQWLLGCAATALVWHIAARLYGRRVARLALGMAALYPPWIHYAGLFLAENPYIACVYAALAALIAGLGASAAGPRAAWALLAGLATGAAGTLKNAVLGPLGGLAIALAAYGMRRREARLLPIALAALIGTSALFVPMAARCTRLTGGRFCLAATNTAMNVLMGHYGRCGMFIWRDAQYATEFHFQSPSTVLRGYTEAAVLPFAAFDTARNLAAARIWSAAHPALALRLSLDNVRDLFFAPTLWPAFAAGDHDLGAASQWLYWTAVLLPAALWLLHRRRALWALAPDALPEWLLLAPTLGQVATVFFSVSEARYRVPLDGLTIILAARGLCALHGPRRAPQAAGAGAGTTPSR